MRAEEFEAELVSVMRQHRGERARTLGWKVDGDFDTGEVTFSFVVNFDAGKKHKIIRTFDNVYAGDAFLNGLELGKFRK